MTTDLSAELRALKPKSLAAQLRPFMPDIDAAIKKGCSHQEIVSILSNNGIEIKPKLLRNYLSKWRQSKNKCITAPNPPPSPPGSQKTNPPPISNMGRNSPIIDSADLLALRHQPVDLQALAKAAPKRST